MLQRGQESTTRVAETTNRCKGKETRALHSSLVSSFPNSVDEKGAARIIMIVTGPGLRKECILRQLWCHTIGGIFFAVWTIPSVSHFVFSLSSAHINMYLDQVQLQRHKHFSEEGCKDGSVWLPDFRWLWYCQHLLFADFFFFSVLSLALESLRLSFLCCLQWGLASASRTTVWQGSARHQVSAWRLIAHHYSNPWDQSRQPQPFRAPIQAINGKDISGMSCMQIRCNNNPEHNMLELTPNVFRLECRCGK